MKTLIVLCLIALPYFAFAKIAKSSYETCRSASKPYADRVSRDKKEFELLKSQQKLTVDKLEKFVKNLEEAATQTKSACNNERSEERGLVKFRLDNIKKKADTYFTALDDVTTGPKTLKDDVTTRLKTLKDMNVRLQLY